jgi:hypothetical protein
MALRKTARKGGRGPGKAKRKNAAHADGNVANLLASIERDYKLPQGCLRANRPSGRKYRSDGSVATLRDLWE